MASYAGYAINKSIELLQNYLKTITQKTEIDLMKFRFKNELNNMLKSIQELLCLIKTEYGTISRGTMYELKEQIQDDLRDIDYIDDKEKIIEKIKLYNTYIDLNFKYIRNNEFMTNVGRLISIKYDSCEELSDEDCHTIINNININRDFNIFSSRARTAKDLALLKDFSSDKATIYGLEKDDDLLIDAKRNCDRTIKGVLNGSRISNDVFDVMTLTPEISWEYEFTETGGLKEKSEKAILRNHIKHLRKNGIFIYTIPYFRLTKDMAMLISKLLDNVQIIKKVNSPIMQIIIIGTKNIIKDPREDVYKLLSEIKYEDIKFTLDNKYNLASGGIKHPEFFRGSALDNDEILNLINTSGLMTSFWNKQKTNIDKKEARPLMPFNMGQIGLVLTSGCLDGLVEEFDGQYHAIKGMVTKVRHTNNNIASNEETSIETISNKVQINIVTPDGQFIELA